MNVPHNRGINNFYEFQAYNARCRVGNIVAVKRPIFVIGTGGGRRRKKGVAKYTYQDKLCQFLRKRRIDELA